MLELLTKTIAAVCPIDGIAIDDGVPRIDFKTEATLEERKAAEAALAAFDERAAAAAAQNEEAKEQLARTTPAAAAGDAKLQVMLDAINECRAALKLAPLTWAEVPAAAEAKLDATAVSSAAEAEVRVS